MRVAVHALPPRAAMPLMGRMRSLKTKTGPLSPPKVLPAPWSLKSELNGDRNMTMLSRIPPEKVLFLSHILLSTYHSLSWFNVFLCICLLHHLWYSNRQRMDPFSLPLSEYRDWQTSLNWVELWPPRHISAQVWPPQKTALLGVAGLSLTLGHHSICTFYHEEDPCQDL